MAKIPTVQRSGDISTGKVAPRIGFEGAEAIASGGRAIARGFGDISRGLESQANSLDARQKQRQTYDDHLWSEGKYTEAQRKWIQWTQDVQKNGSEDVVEQFDKEYQKYQSEVLAQAPSAGARDQLRLKLDDLGTQVFDSSMKIEASNRSRNTVNTFEKMLIESSDLIADAPEAYVGQQARLSATLKLSVDQKRISPEIAQKMQNTIDALAADAAEAMIPKNPEMAREIITSAKGVDWTRRKSILNQIDQATKTNDTLFHYQQQQLLESTVSSVVESGKVPDAFNADTYAASFPKNQQAAARADALSKVEVAKTAYVGKTELQGKSIAGINEVLSKYEPKPGSAKYADELAAFKHIAQIADNQVKLLRADSFSYARQDPIVDGAWKLVEDLPEDTTPGLRAQLTSQAMDASVNFQRSLGVPDGKLSVMSNSQATGLAAQINQGDVQAVQQTFSQMQQNFGKYYSNAFRDLARLPEGQRIDGAMQIVGLHMGAPFLADFIQAIRTPSGDYKVEAGDRRVIAENLATNGDFMAFSSALTAANPGAVSYVDDFNRAIDKYATSLYFRGKADSPEAAVEQAAKSIITSAYLFTEVGGSSVAIKRTQDNASITEEDVGPIKSALSLAPRNIDIKKIDTTRFQFPDNITQDVKDRSIRDTMTNDTFWSTNSQNDGAVLYMNGVDGTAAPVKYKDGKNVEMKFMDIVSEYRGRKPAAPEKFRPADWR